MFVFVLDILLFTQSVPVSHDSLHFVQTTFTTVLIRSHTRIAYMCKYMRNVNNISIQKKILRFLLCAESSPKRYGIFITQARKRMGKRKRVKEGERKKNDVKKTSTLSVSMFTFGAYRTIPTMCCYFVVYIMR